jgi:hypothetical protein
MATKWTRNDVVRNYSNIYYVGYCEMYHLLGACRKIGWNDGIYGWNYSIYEIDYNTCVLTGYRGMFGSRIDRATYEKYEKKAKDIYNGVKVPYKNLSYEKRQEKIKKLVEKMFQEMGMKEGATK